MTTDNYGSLKMIRDDQELLGSLGITRDDWDDKR